VAVRAQRPHHRLGRHVRIDRDAEQGCALAHALEVVGEAEHRRAVACRVGADPFEHAAAVVQRMGGHADARPVGIDEFAVEPYACDRG
jgi:hypothetical protein